MINFITITTKYSEEKANESLSRTNIVIEMKKKTQENLPLAIKSMTRNMMIKV